MKTLLYVIPGLMCDARLWSRIKPLLEDEYELIHLAIPLENSLEKMAQKIKVMIKNEPINLLGFSLGGYLAAYFSVLYPNSIKKLMIMSATAASLPEDEIHKRQMLFQLSSTTTIKGLSHKKIVSLLDKKHHDNHFIIDLIAQMYEQLGQEVFKLQIESTLHRKDLSHALSKLTLPIIFVYSKNDILINTSWMNKIKETSTIEFVAHNSSSHMLPLEEPEYCAENIRYFFNLV